MAGKYLERDFVNMHMEMMRKRGQFVHKSVKDNTVTYSVNIDDFSSWLLVKCMKQK
jgi:hypothetical protein